MAISDTQKVDFLWKKIGFGKVKTDVNSLKNATNESITSPLLLRGSEVWAESSSIPAVMPGSSSGVVTVYPTSSPVETTEDITASTDRTWKTSLSDWIPPEIASTYLVKVYIHNSGDAANAASSGTQIFGAGSGNSDEWFFDYQAGVLNFIGTNLPSGISGKSIYISGARYTGTKGVSTPGGSESFASVNVTGIVTASGGAELSSIRIGIAASTEIDTIAGDLILDSSAGRVNIDDHLNVVGVSTFASAVDINSSIDVDGLAELDDVNVSSAATVANLTATQTAELQFGGSKKFETIGTGVSISNGISTVATIAGPSQITIDPAAVGDNTGIVVIAGNLQVDGTQTVVNSTTMTVDDKNLELGTGAANDAAADGGGITIVSGDGNKTFQFEDSGDNLGSSENLNLASGKDYKIDNTSVLNATTLGSGVVNSSLTSVGTLTSLDVNGHTELDNLNVSGVSTFSGSIGFSNGADIGGHTELDDVNVSSAATITGALDVGGDLDVDGTTELDVLNVAETATFSANIDANGDLDVDGQTELDTLNVSGVSTFVGNIDANVATFTSAAVEDLTDNRVVIAGSGGELEDSANLTFDGSTLNVVGLADLDDVNVSSAATITGALDVDGGADISGGETVLSSATISDLTDNRVLIAGTSGAVEDSANLTFDGSTLNVIGLADLDDVNVSSAATIATAVVTSATVSSLTMAGVAVTAILDDMTTGRADALVTQQSVKNYIDTNVTAQDLDIAADSGTGAVDLDSQSLTLSGTANEIETSASGQTITIGLPDDVTIGNNLTVTTATNLGGMLNVTGISTFASAVDVNAAINVSGLSELADVSVSSAATITGALDVNGGADISGGETTLSSVTISDLTDNRVLIAGTSGAVEDSANLTFDGSTLNVVGLADLDDVNVSSAATIATAVVTNATITSLTMAGVAVTAILDEDDMSSDRADAIPTQQSVKAYVGSQLTAQDLDFQGDAGGTLSVDLDSQSLIIAGTSNEIETSGSGQTLTIGLPDAVEITTSLDVPTVEATNLKAKDGTTAITITDATGAVECASNLTVGGNLYVNGSTTQVNTNQTTIEDQLLELGMVDGSAPSSDLDKDIGVIFNYYTTSAKKAAVYWDDSTSRIVVSSDVSESSGVLTNSASGALEIGSLYVNGCTGSTVEVIGCDSSTVVITNATIDGGSF